LNITVEIKEATTTPTPIARPFKTLSIVVKEKLDDLFEEERKIDPSRKTYLPTS
jgi:hypothetical protein